MAASRLHPLVRVKPSLLDRLLAPAEGQAEVAPGEPDGLSEKVFRDTVLRDIEWLFNATSRLDLSDPKEVARFPQLAGSVLNFGLRGLFGKVVHDLAEIEQAVQEALARFEPRLAVDRQEFKVSREGQLVEIRIEGFLRTQLANRRLTICTDLEVLQTSVELTPNG